MFVVGFCGPAYALNYALDFSADDDLHRTGDYVTIPGGNSLDLNTGMTIEAWIKPYSLAGDNVIVSKWFDGSPLDSYIFKIYDVPSVGHKLRIELVSAPHQTFVDLRGDSIITPGDWIHVATTFDSSVTKLFFNGLEDGSQSSAGTIQVGEQDVYIGFVERYGQVFDGLIDEVRIWNYARTPQQIQDWMYYSLFGDESGLVGYWNFDEGSGQITHDLSLYGNHGQLGSTPDVDDHDPAWILSDGTYGRVIPEPSSMLLLGSGLAGLAAFRRRKKA